MTDTGVDVSGSLNFKAMFFAALVRAAGWSHRKHMLGQTEHLKKKAGNAWARENFGWCRLGSFQPFHFKEIISSLQGGREE